MVIVDNNSIVSGSWGDIDKTSLANELKEANSPAAIRETYLFVGDLSLTTTWKFPHHILVGDTLKVHRGGVHAAAQRLVSSGATATDIPKRAAARHLIKHYKAMGEEPPESLVELSKFASLSEAVTELRFLEYLKDSPLYEEIESISKEVLTLVDTGEAVRTFTRDSVTKAISLLIEVEVNCPCCEKDDIDESMEEEHKSLKTLVQEKGQNVELCEDNKTLIVKGLMSFSNIGKKSIEDYYATEEELELINSRFSNIDLSANDIIVLTLRSADMAVDRSFEHFTEKALKRMAELSVGKAFLLDHKWETSSHIGKIFAATTSNGQLIQKVYLLNDEYNKKLIKNILAGIFNKVSVGFAVDYADMICDSCVSKSYYDESCPHRAGSLDANNKQVTITIGDVIDYFEVSIVPIPAQRDAGIYRSVESKTIDLVKGAIWSDRPKSIDKNLAEKIINDLQEILNKQPEYIALAQTEIKNEDSDTINIDRSNLGDIVVPPEDNQDNELISEEKAAEGNPQEDQEVVETQEDENTKSYENKEESSSLEEETTVSEKSQEGNEPEKLEQAVSRMEKAAETISEAVSKLGQLVQDQGEMIKALAEANESKSALLEGQLKEQGERLVLLCMAVEAAVNNTVETKIFEAGSESSTKSTSSSVWLEDILQKGFFAGGQQ